jgi:hypothetical protein
MILSGCHTGQKDSGDQDVVAGIVLDGEELELTTEKNRKITDRVIDFVKRSDDFYELIVTENLINSIRNNERSLEIEFPEPRTFVTHKYGELKVSRIIIPLSGRYAAADQITFFSYNGNFSNTPLICTSGLAELLRVIGE